MAEIAKRIYEKPDEKMKVIGVTGTNGKTSVTHLLREIFINAGEAIGLIGTIGCYFNDTPTNDSFTTSTTPEASELYCILNNMYNCGAKTAVMEVSSHALSLDRVYNMSYDVGVFTNLTQDHLDFHKNMEEYFKAKEKLFDMSAFCVINTDDEYGKRLYKRFGYKSLSYGFSNADITAENIKYTTKGAFFTIHEDNLEYDAYINIPGGFSVYNALGVYAVGRVLHIPSGITIDTLKNTKGIRGRAERIECGTDFSVIIDYAHTPDGMINILNAVRKSSFGRIITVFGCGGNRDKAKRAVMGKIAGELSDYTVLTSDNPRFEDPVKIINDIEEGISETTNNYAVVPDRYEAIEYAIRIVKPDDTVLLLGKGHEDYIEKDGKKIHFDEREAVKEILQRMSKKCNLKPERIMKQCTN